MALSAATLETLVKFPIVTIEKCKHTAMHCTIAPLHHCTIARCGFEGMGIRVGSPIKAYLDAVLSLPATDPSREDAWGVASSICGLLPGVMESFCDGTGCVSGMMYTTQREREREREREAPTNEGEREGRMEGSSSVGHSSPCVTHRDG